jgi:hypothetical protein
MIWIILIPKSFKYRVLETCSYPQRQDNQGFLHSFYSENLSGMINDEIGTHLGMGYWVSLLQYNMRCNTCRKRKKREKKREETQNPGTIYSWFCFWKPPLPEPGGPPPPRPPRSRDHDYGPHRDHEHVGPVG